MDVRSGRDPGEPDERDRLPADHPIADVHQGG